VKLWIISDLVEGGCGRSGKAGFLRVFSEGLGHDEHTPLTRESLEQKNLRETLYSRWLGG